MVGPGLNSEELHCRLVGAVDPVELIGVDFRQAVEELCSGMGMSLYENALEETGYGVHTQMTEPIVKAIEGLGMANADELETLESSVDEALLMADNRFTDDWWDEWDEEVEMTEEAGGDPAQLLDYSEFTRSVVEKLVEYGREPDQAWISVVAESATENILSALVQAMLGKYGFKEHVESALLSACEEAIDDVLAELPEDAHPSGIDEYALALKMIEMVRKDVTHWADFHVSSIRDGVMAGIGSRMADSRDQWKPLAVEAASSVVRRYGRQVAVDSDSTDVWRSPG